MVEANVPDWIEHWLMAMGAVGLIGMFAGVLIGSITLNILHLILPRRFDPHLLKPEFFEPAFRAIVTASGWPMSLLRTQTYALFVMMPTKVPRFRSVVGDSRLAVSGWIHGLCWISFQARPLASMGCNPVTRIMEPWRFMEPRQFLNQALGLMNSTLAKSTSQSFHLAAQRCFKQRTLAGGQIESLVVPAIVCEAFAVELAFKALLLDAGRELRGHNLKCLFDEIDSQIRNRIILATGMIDADFHGALCDAARAFDDWRYVHERSTLHASTGFLSKLAVVALEAGNK